VAALTSALGAEHFDVAEDATQDAILSVLKAAERGEHPADLSSWLYRVARNRALDLLRRSGRLTPLGFDDVVSQPDPNEGPESDAELLMLLMCCHTSLPATARVALALSAVGGLTAPQIARALLMTEPALRQVLVRAKRRLRDESVDLAVVGPADLEARLESALATIYLIFNEGYFSLDGERVVRDEMCKEAVRMCGLLLDSPRTTRPDVHALTALLLFQMSRLSSRTDDKGDMVLLARQDRSTWDQRLLGAAFQQLELAAAGDRATTYHLEAEIASYHARAPSFEKTDWSAIIAAYDALSLLNPTPIVTLNRAVAIAERDGANRALEAMESLEKDQALVSYPFYYTARGDLLLRAGREPEARQAFERALALATSHPVQRFVEDRLKALSKLDGFERL
jgi:RNA polymerase sigma-70 factor (ECF subfamily)